MSSPVNRRAYHKEHYRQNKAAYLARTKARQDSILAMVRARKDKPCMDCGGRFLTVAMDFDHRPGEDKGCEPSGLHKAGWSRTRVEAELDKCDVVCSNCHRVRTHERAAAALGPNERCILGW